MFQRGIAPKESMKTGKYDNPTKVRCLKNMYNTAYKKCCFTRKNIYPYKKEGFIDVVYDIYNQPVMFAEKTFKEYFEIHS